MLSFKTIQTFVFTAVLLGSLVALVWLISPYSYAIFWAAVIAALAQPLYQRFLKLCKQHAPLAAAGTMVTVVLICLIPIGLVLSVVIQQAISFYTSIHDTTSLATISEAVNKLLATPWLVNITGPIDVKAQLYNGASGLSGYAYQLLASSGQNTVWLLIQVAIMLYSLYFFIKDGERILRKIMFILPLGDSYEQQLYQRFVSTTRATLKGTLLIGMIQGVIGGLAFWIAGVPAALFWSVIMIVLSIIPAVGASPVLGGGALIFAVLGNYTGAIILVVGLVCAGLIDNILRGPLVGKDTQLHPLLIFFSTLGGLGVFGISGVVIGPVLMALAVSMLEIYQHIYRPELKKAD